MKLYKKKFPLDLLHRMGILYEYKSIKYPAIAWKIIELKLLNVETIDKALIWCVPSIIVAITFILIIINAIVVTDFVKKVIMI